MAKRWAEMERSEAFLARRVLFHYDTWLYIPGFHITSGNVVNQPACYVLYIDGQLSYVGQSNTPAFRFRQHQIRNFDNMFQTPWGEFEDLYCKIYYPSRYGYESMLEKRLIKKIKPRFNKYTYRRKQKFGL